MSRYDLIRQRSETLAVMMRDNSKDKPYEGYYSEFEVVDFKKENKKDNEVGRTELIDITFDAAMDYLLYISKDGLARFDRGEISTLSLDDLRPLLSVLSNFIKRNPIIYWSDIMLDGQAPQDFVRQLGSLLKYMNISEDVRSELVEVVEGLITLHDSENKTPAGSADIQRYFVAPLEGIKTDLNNPDQHQQKQQAYRQERLARVAAVILSAYERTGVNIKFDGGVLTANKSGLFSFRSISEDSKKWIHYLHAVSMKDPGAEKLCPTVAPGKTLSGIMQPHADKFPRPVMGIIVSAKDEAVPVMGKVV